MKLLEYDTNHNIRAFSTYRGEGSGNYEGFNITHYCGDSTEHVAKCRKELCYMLGIDESRLILPRQTHGKGISCIDEKFLAMPKLTQNELLHGIDAIITDIPGICIGVSTADCIPILLYDSKRDVVAAVHAGWRGTVARIVQECIKVMKSKYGCNSDEIKGIIAPGISVRAFEVGNEVYTTFKNNGFIMEGMAQLYPTTQGEKWHIDLWECNCRQMSEEGIKRENIYIAGICTYENHDKFFSARRLGINSGRIFNGIMITE